MPVADSVLPEFDHEVAITRRVIERVNADFLAWSPHEKSMTLGRLATHLAEILKWGQTILRDAEFDMGAGGAAPRSLASVPEMLGILDETARSVRARIAEMADPEWAVTWVFKSHGKVIFSVPRSTAFRSWVMNHMIHHRGQLSVYLRQTGSLVPGIYGPSADEGS
jgi:uncharacterized damage-inducible protein DinB